MHIRRVTACSCMEDSLAYSIETILVTTISPILILLLKSTECDLAADDAFRLQPQGEFHALAHAIVY